MPDGVKVAQVTLTHLVMVRIHVGQPVGGKSEPFSSSVKKLCKLLKCALKRKFPIRLIHHFRPNFGRTHPTVFDLRSKGSGAVHSGNYSNAPRFVFLLPAEAAETVASSRNGWVCRVISFCQYSIIAGGTSALVAAVRHPPRVAAST